MLWAPNPMTGVFIKEIPSEENEVYTGRGDNVKTQGEPHLQTEEP